jgi:two-component system sensor kinase FixL
VRFPLELAAAVVDAAPEGILVVSREGRIEAANPRAEVMFGWPPGELVGQSIEAPVPPELRERHVELRESFFASPGRRTIRVTATFPSAPFSSVATASSS